MYYGNIKTKKQAMAIAKRLRDNNGSQRAVDCAKMLENNWQYIASRPAIQPEIIAMSETTPLWRKDSIMNKIISGNKWLYTILVLLVFKVCGRFAMKLSKEWIEHSPDMSPCLRAGLITRDNSCPCGINRGIAHRHCMGCGRIINIKNSNHSLTLNWKTGRFEWLFI